jgi:archaellum component FlaC
VANAEPQVASADPAGQEIEQLKQQVLLARTEIREKDRDIQELQTLVEALTQTINQLQGLEMEAVLSDVGAVQDVNELEGDVQE